MIIMIKLNKKSYVMTAAAIATIGLASCSNELNDGALNKPGTVEGVSLVKSPDVVAWSGNQTFGNTLKSGVSAYATRAGSDASFERWQNDRTWTKPHDIIASERDYVLKYLQDHPNGGYKTIDLDTYVIQVVGGGNHSYDGDTPDHNGTSHTIGNATSQMNQCKIDGFFTQYNNGQMNSEDCILIKNVPATNATYHDSNGNLTQENLYSFYYITFPDSEEYGYMAGKTGLYLCYDYATYKDSEKWGVSPDGIYDDWVIKLSMSDGSDMVDPSSGDSETGGDKEEEKPGNDGAEVVNPEEHNHEVEVNYAILDEHKYDSGIADLVTKLSIHVRHATNVDIKIPILNKYLVESDDLYIFKEHYNKPDGEYDGAYGGVSNPLENEKATISYEVKNADGTTVGTVVLHVDFKAGDATLGSDFEEGYIHVWTEGITPAVIDACWDYNKDGINFEIYNYFQTEKAVWNDGDEIASVVPASQLNRGALLEAMNKAVIEFENEPDYYINAFGYEDDWEIEGNPEIKPVNHEHATVKPASGEGYGDEPNYRTHHLNGTPYNDIYVHESVEEADDLHKNNG